MSNAGTLKAIETIYNGYRFRSRLEARWAVFVDALKVKYVYEPEGFDLDGIWYLPDFWLPQVGMWAEVKAASLTKQERFKCQMLAKLSGYPCLELIGKPEDKPYYAWQYYEYADGGDFEFMEYCLTNYHDYPTQEGRFYCAPGNEEDSHFPDTAIATRAARQARFEHGEFPQ